MALLICPDCSAQVSDLALTCPHCGRPLSAYGEAESGEGQEDLAIDAAVQGEGDESQGDFALDPFAEEGFEGIEPYRMSWQQALFSPAGRLPRSAFFGYSLALIALYVVAFWLDPGSTVDVRYSFSNHPDLIAEALVGSWYMTAFGWLLWFPNLMIHIKRFHDRGHSGWALLWFLPMFLNWPVSIWVTKMLAENPTEENIAVLGFVMATTIIGGCICSIWMLVRLCRPSEPGLQNQYGPHPLGGQ